MTIHIKREREDSPFANDSNDRDKESDESRANKRRCISTEEEEDPVVPDGVYSSTSSNAMVTPRPQDTVPPGKVPETLTVPTIVGPRHDSSGDDATATPAKTTLVTQKSISVNKDATVTKTKISSSTLPSSSQLSLELCKLVDLDNYSVEEDSLPTLKRLLTWMINKDTNPKDKEKFIKAFVTLATIPRVVDFVQRHLSEPLCVVLGTKVLALCPTHAFKMTSTEKYGVKMAESIVDYNGIDTLLQVNEKYCMDDLRPLSWVWKTLHCLVSIKDSRELMTHPQQTKVFDAALECLEKLRNGNIKAESIVFRIMKTLAKSIDDDSFMSSQMAVLKEKKFISRCVTSLERKTDINGKIFRIGDEDCIVTTLLLIGHCITRGKHRLVVDSDWLTFIPFCVSVLATFPDSGEVRRQGMWLLERSVENIDTKKMHHKVYIIENITFVLKSASIADNVKEEALNVLNRMNAR